jgi:hypothetical protein
MSGKDQASRAERQTEERARPADRFEDSMTPELAARLQQRRNGQPPREAPCLPEGEAGADRQVPRGRAMEGGPGRHGHGPDRAPRFGRPEGERAIPRLAPGEDPAQAAEALHAALDADGDGAVTREEVLSYLQAQTAPQAAPVTETEVDTPVAELPVANDPAAVPVAETPAAPETTESADYYAAVHAQVVAQLEGYLQQADVPAEVQVLATSALAAVMALSPSDPDFEAKLNQAIAPLMAPETAEETETVTTEG